MKYEGDNPVCFRGHDKRVVGVSPSGWCVQCRIERDHLRKLKSKRNKDSYNGERALMPGLREVREALSIRQVDLAREVGVTAKTLRRIEAGETAPGVSTRRGIEDALIRKRGSVARLYGVGGMVWRSCEAAADHPPWASVSLRECPRCLHPERPSVPEPNSLSKEELAALVERVPDRGQFDFILNEKGAAIRAAFTGDRDADIEDVVDVLGEEEVA